MTAMTIGQLAQHAGIGVETIRFYERRGLIEDPPRRASGYRQYPPATIDRLLFIRRAKELGFSLDEIGELLLLRSHPSANRPQVRAKARAKVADIEQRITDLDRMRTVLLGLIETCAQQHPAAAASAANEDACPILNALEGRVPVVD